MKEMRAEVLDKFIEAILACKTYKEITKLQKQFAKEYNQDDVIRAAMAYGREQFLAQAIAYVKDLEDKQPLTIKRRLQKFRQRVRLFFYYHQSTAWYMMYIGSLWGQIFIAHVTGIYEMIPQGWFSSPFWYLIITQILLSECLAYWFRRETHKVQ